MKKLIGPLLIIALILGGGMLMRFGTDRRDERGATRLMRSIESGADSLETEKLIARSNDVNVEDNAGRTALFYAVLHSQKTDLLSKLLQEGAAVNVADNNGQHVLFVAAGENPSPEVAEFLISSGAAVNTADKNGQTPLMLAAQKNNKEVLSIFLRAGADTQAKDAQGKTAADYLLENPNLTDQEKTDYRQAMLVLYLLKPLAK
mgnify:CR=1 FL=1